MWTYLSAVPWVSFNSNVRESPLDKKLSVRAQVLDRRKMACSQVLGARSRQKRAINVALVGGRPTMTDWADVARDICTDRSLSLKMKKKKFNENTHFVVTEALNTNLDLNCLIFSFYNQSPVSTSIFFNVTCL